MISYAEAFKKEPSWIKRIVLVELYHLTQQHKHKKWKVSDTAKYFGVSQSLISENLQLARALERIETCRSRNEALKLLKKA